MVLLFYPLTSHVPPGKGLPPVTSTESQGDNGCTSVQLSGAEPVLVITSDWVGFVVVNVIVVLETLITAWLRIVIATCWLRTRVPLSVSEIVISALMNPAGARVMSGVTVITAVLSGATVPCFGETGAKADPFTSSAAAHLSGAFPVLEMVNDCGAGWVP